MNETEERLARIKEIPTYHCNRCNGNFPVKLIGELCEWCIQEIAAAKQNSEKRTAQQAIANRRMKKQKKFKTMDLPFGRIYRRQDAKNKQSAISNDR